MSVAATLAPAAPVAARDPIRVMIVDDAVVVRGLVSRWVDEEPGLKIVASLRTGREAVDQLLRHNPDVVVLDIDMPDLNGIEALPLLLEKKRDLVVIMASTLTRRNAEISLRALALGAADYIPKPATTGEITGSESFRRELIDKIFVLGSSRSRVLGFGAALPADVSARRLDPASMPRWKDGRHSDFAATEQRPAIKLRPFAAMTPCVLLVGASTGGPQALNALLGHIKG